MEIVTISSDPFPPKH